MIIDKEEKWVSNVWRITRMTPMGRDVIAHHCCIVYFSCYFSRLEDSSGLSSVTMHSFPKQQALLPTPVAWNFETSPS